MKIKTKRNNTKIIIELLSYNYSFALKKYPMPINK